MKGLKRYDIRPIYNHTLGHMFCKERVSATGDWTLFIEAEAAIADLRAAIAGRDKEIAELERKYEAMRKALSDISYAFISDREAILMMKKIAREALEKGEL